MNNLIFAIRSLSNKGRHNILKISTLSIGLAVGLVLIAKICFEQSYDTFYPDAKRTYRVMETFKNQKGTGEYGWISGAVAPTMKAEIPGVEAATRLTNLADAGTSFTTPDKQRYSVEHAVFMADSNVFDLLPRTILLGDPKEVLARPGYVMISHSLAEKMGGLDKVDEMAITPDDYPDWELTIGGVFEDVPENSHLRYDMLVSLNTMDEESLNNWIGNERYFGYIRLAPGITAESLEQPIHDMQLRHLDQEQLRKLGMEQNYFIKPMLELHTGNEDVRNMVMMLLVLASALLFTAVMNYILIAISSIVNRTKEVAVHKSYGASEVNIHSMIMSETFVHMMIALALAVFLIFASQDMIQELLDISVYNLLFSRSALALLTVCMVIFIIIGFVPGTLFARIPVASAFRHYREHKRKWKLCLLFFQFIVGGLLMSMLVVVAQQHNFMVNSNPGYAYDRLAYTKIEGLDSTARAKVIEEMERIPEIEMVSTCENLFLSDMGGNNIFLPGRDEEALNVADQYNCGNGYLKLMEVAVIEGRSFAENVQFSNEVMVNRTFAEKMEKAVGWADGVVGKEILITEHTGTPDENVTVPGAYRICGVYENYRIGSLVSSDERPSVLFYNSHPSPILMLKFHQMDAGAIKKVDAKLQELMPHLETRLSLYSTDMVNLYSNSRKFQKQLWIGGLVTLLISIIGLIGYTNDEVNRRCKEIAVRKVNGATLLEIQQIFQKDVLCIAVPAALIGATLAYVLSAHWQQQFVEKVPLDILFFIGGSLIIIFTVSVSILYRTWFAANSNPVESLKSE